MSASEFPGIRQIVASSPAQKLSVSGPAVLFEASVGSRLGSSCKLWAFAAPEDPRLVGIVGAGTFSEL